MRRTLPIAAGSSRRLTPRSTLTQSKLTRSIAVLGASLSLLTLSACGDKTESPQSPTSQLSSEAAPAGEGAPAQEPDTTVELPPADQVLDSNLPIDALPETPEGKAGWVECPYLETQWVADTNGQRMTGLGIDERFDTPACVFWSYPDEPQLTVIVRHMHTPEEATAVVDWAAPIDTTEPAEEPEGWSGGRVGGGIAGHETALYAVAKGTVAVVVFTNQEQSLKAELVAKEVIQNLSL